MHRPLRQTGSALAVALLAFASAARAQSDPAGFDTVFNFPTTVLGNVVTGPLPGATLPVLPGTAQFNFNAGGLSTGNLITGFGNEVNVFPGATVDNLSLGLGTTLNLLGGDVAGGLTLDSPNPVNPTVANLLSGGIGGTVSINGTSRVVIQTGVGVPLTLAGSPLVEIGDGADIASIDAPDAASVIVTGGAVGPIVTDNSARVTVSGGVFSGLFEARADAFVNISGGGFDAIDVAILNDLNIAGGFIESLEFTSTSGAIHVSGGEFGDGEFLIGGDAVVNITGGVIGDNVQIEGDAVVNASGGAFGADVDVDGDATLNLIGTRFLVDGADVTGDVAAAGPGGLPINSAAPPMLIEAVLADGTPVAFAFQPESLMLGDEVSTLDANATVNLILGDPRLDGDFNADGVVSAADYTLFRDNLDPPFTGFADAERSEAPIHFNGDGLFGVDAGDFAVFARNFGAATAAAPAAVPEPAAAWLIACGSAFGWRLGRRR